MKWLRTAASVLLAVLGALSISAGVIVNTVRGAAFDTDRFVAVTLDLVADDEFRDEIAEELSTKFGEEFREIDEIPAAELAAAGTSAGELREKVDSTVRKAVGLTLESDSFRSAWAAAARASHTQFVALVEAEADATSGVRVDLSALGSGINEQLKELGKALPQELDLDLAVPADADLDFEVMEAKDMGTARDAYRGAGTARIALVVAALVFLGGAVLLGVSRRTGARAAAASIAAAGGIVLIVRRVAAGLVEGISDGSPLAGSVFDTVTSPATRSALVLCAVGVLATGATFLRRR